MLNKHVIYFFTYDAEPELPASGPLLSAIFRWWNRGSIHFPSALPQ